MASVIVLNSKSSCSASAFCESNAGAMTVATGATVLKRVLTDFQRFICHHSSVVESAAIKKFSYPSGPRFDSGRKHATSDSHGFEHIDPESRVLNYCFQ